MKFFSTALVLFFSVFAFATGPSISGGTSETAFEHDLVAIKTILDTPEVMNLMKHQGRMLSLRPDLNRLNVYILTTEKCEVSIKFNRTCSVDHGRPSCDFSSAIISDENSCSSTNSIN